MKTNDLRPLKVSAIAIINGIAAVLSLLFWYLVQHRLFGVAHLSLSLDPTSVASTLGFMVADLIWAIPLLIVSGLGLWRLQAWGWTTAQVANLLWLYPLTAAWTRDLYLGSISPGNLLFLPFALFAVWTTCYLWQIRHLFWARTEAISDD